MELHTEREQVLNVAYMWTKQYPSAQGDKLVILKKLKSLDKRTASASDVEKIIGNRSWVRPPTCNECGKATYQSAMMGEAEDYESATATICLGCLKKAVDMIEKAEADNG